MQINDDSYVELLAMLCRKGFGRTRIKHVPSDGAKVTSVAEEYEAEEKREPKTRGSFGCEAQGGKLAIFAVEGSGVKPWILWIEE